jgi:hypothetical protein
MRHLLQDRTKENNVALEQAWKQLLARDVGEVARMAWSDRCGGSILLPFFETELLVDPMERLISEKGQKVDTFVAVLGLHYLLGCGQAVPSGRKVPFTQASGGELYFSAFKNRSIDRLAELFGPDPSLLFKAGSMIGGESAHIGSGSVLVHVFPKVPVTAIVWQGDEEIPASANILFDEVALSILPTEDLAVVGSLLVSRLKRARG